MADPFVTLNGESGEFFSRADVNILDADTAHMLQSIGQWAGYATEPSPDSFSGVRMFLLMDGTNNMLTQPQSFSVTAGVVNTASIFIEPEDGLDRTYIVIDYYNIGGDQFASSGVLGSVNPTPAERAERVVQFTPDAGAVTGRFRVFYRDGTTGDVTDKVLRIDSAMIALGTEPTFVPSLRIVGNGLDIRSRVRSEPWTVAFNTGILGYPASAPERRYNQILLASSVAHFWYDTDDVQRQATIAHGITDTDTHDLRTVHLYDGGTLVDVELFVDDVSEGTAQITVAGPIRNAPGVATIGNNSSVGSQQFIGDMEFVEIRDGIDGPIVYRFDAADVLASVT